MRIPFVSACIYVVGILGLMISLANGNAITACWIFVALAATLRGDYLEDRQ